MAPLTFYVGATLGGWPAISHPLIRLELTDDELALFARAAYAVAVAYYANVDFVPGKERQRLLWCSRVEDLILIKRGFRGALLLTSTKDDRRIRIATPRASSMRRLEAALSSRLE